jgi:multiple antibiotic resistance protein
MAPENSFIAALIKIFFLLTPFFILSMFVAMTRRMSRPQRNAIAAKTMLSNLIICLLLYFFGAPLFYFLGITLDAFRIGAGTILFFSAYDLISGKTPSLPDAEESDIAVVPLSIPFTIGPGTIGALLVMGGSAATAAEKMIDVSGIVTAVLLAGSMLFVSNWIECAIGRKGLNILSKLTGLMLAALASQIIFTGIKNFLFSK